jgi:hypothetical protein
MIKAPSVQKLIERTPLAVIVLGLVLIIAAAGGWPSPSLQVNEMGWRVALGIMGAVIAGVGTLLLWRETVIVPQSNRESSMSTDYGIKIISPQDGDSVSGPVPVLGTFVIEPPDEGVQLFNISPDQRHYWPQGPQNIKIDPVKKTWSGKSWVLGDTFIMVAIIGKAGRVLCDYYLKVGRETGSWPPLEQLTDDIYECDRIWVRKTTSSRTDAT